MLSDKNEGEDIDEYLESRLNAPFGARCFLTAVTVRLNLTVAIGLNAPFGARCFLTPYPSVRVARTTYVLMHLLALGAF